MKEIIDTLEKERTEYKERAKKIAAKLQGHARTSKRNNFLSILIKRV